MTSQESSSAVSQQAASAGRWIDRHAFSVATAVLVIYYLSLQIYLTVQRFLGNDQLPAWDPMLLSGSASCIVGLYFAMQLDKRMGRTIRRLVRSCVVQRKASRRTSDHERTHIPPGSKEISSVEDCLTKDSLGETAKELAGNVEHRAEKTASQFGLIMSLAMLLAFIPYVIVNGFNALAIIEATMEVAVAYVAGRIIGRMVAYGRLGRYLRENNYFIKAQPGHPDDVAGLKPLGDFYFFQAKVIAILPAYLGIWLVILTLWDTRYAVWQMPYLFLLVVALTIVNLVFILPLISFHNTMRDQKSEHIDRADELSRQILADKAFLAECESDAKRAAVEERLAVTLQQYRDIAAMPTWPLDLPTRKKYGLGNLLMTFPIANFFAMQDNPGEVIGQWAENVAKWLGT